MIRLILMMFLLAFSIPCFGEIIDDEFANMSLVNVKTPETHLSYDYKSVERIPIKMSFSKDYGSEKDVYEGQIVELKIKKDVISKGQVILKKDDIVTAKIGVLITPGMNGIPASVILQDFSIADFSRSRITDSYEIFGQDRSLLVFPLKWALTFLPPTGSLTNFIMGGHVRLKPKKEVTVYYYPEWI